MFVDVPSLVPVAAAATGDAVTRVAALDSTVGVHCPFTSAAAPAVAPGWAVSAALEPAGVIAGRAAAGWLGRVAADGAWLDRRGVGLALGLALGDADTDTADAEGDGAGLLLGLDPIGIDGAGVPADAGRPGPPNKAAEPSTRTTNGPVTRGDTCTH